MLTCSIIAILVVIPGLSCAASWWCPRLVYWLGMTLIGLGLLNFLTLFVASKTGLPLNPYLLVATAMVCLFGGMSMCMGFGIWKIPSRNKGP